MVAFRYCRFILIMVNGHALCEFGLLKFAEKFVELSVVNFSKGFMKT